MAKALEALTKINADTGRLNRRMATIEKATGALIDNAVLHCSRFRGSMACLSSQRVAGRFGQSGGTEHPQRRHIVSRGTRN
jgi:hypothetical protein